MNILNIIRLIKKKYLFFALLLSVSISLITLLSLIFPLLYRQFIDEIVLKTINWNIVFKMIILFLFSLFAETFFTYLYLKVHTDIEKDLKYSVYKTTLTFDEKAIKKKGEGYFVELIDNCVYHCISILTPHMFRSVFSIIKSVIITIILLRIDLFVSFLSFLFILSNIILFIINKKYYLPKVDDVLSGYRQTSSLLTENLINISLINAFPLYKKYSEKEFQEQLLELKRKNFSVEWYYESIYNMISKYLFPFLRIFILVHCAQKVINNSYSMGTMIMIVSYVATLELGMNGLSQITEMLFQANASIKALYEFTSNATIKKEVQVAETKYFFKLSNVEKRFGNRIIFEKLNFTFECGKIYGLQGKNGLGKSSLVNILLNLEKDFLGDVYFLNENNDVKNTDYLNDISILKQDSPIVNKNLMYNITLGNEYNENYYNQIVSEIGFEHITDDSLGAAGNNISGGEKRKIIIARFLYNLKDKSFFIIDEAFLSLDEENKQKLLDIIKKYIKNKTGLIISHDKKILSVLCSNLIELKTNNITHT